MKITLLGTGAALIDPDRGHTSIAVQIGEKTYLIDCGSGATRSLVGAFIDPLTIEALFLTHLHYDHIADLPALVIGSWISNRQAALPIYGPRGTEHFVGHLFEGGAFDVDIRARGAYPQRQANMQALRPELHLLSPGTVFEDDRLRVIAAKADHIPEDICPCFAFRFETEDRVFVFSGDTTPVPEVQALAEGADLLVHEATFPEAAIKFRAESGIGTFSHTSPKELGRLAKAAGVKTLVATHIGHWDSTNPIVRRLAGRHMPAEIMGPQLIEEVVADIRESFAGPLHIAADGMAFHI